MKIHLKNLRSNISFRKSWPGCSRWSTHLVKSRDGSLERTTLCHCTDVTRRVGDPFGTKQELCKWLTCWGSQASSSPVHLTRSFCPVTGGRRSSPTKPVPTIKPARDLSWVSRSWEFFECLSELHKRSSIYSSIMLERRAAAEISSTTTHTTKSLG